jgi:hypothetical protein
MLKKTLSSLETNDTVVQLSKQAENNAGKARFAFERISHDLTERVVQILWLLLLFRCKKFKQDIVSPAICRRESGYGKQLIHLFNLCRTGHLRTGNHRCTSDYQAVVVGTPQGCMMCLLCFDIPQCCILSASIIIDLDHHYG